MKDYLFRLKYIGLPFIYVCWGTTLLLMLLRWLFAIEFPVLDYADRTWEETFAVVMPWPGILVFLLKHVWSLEFRRANGRFGIRGDLICMIFIFPRYIIGIGRHSVFYLTNKMQIRTSLPHR